MNKLLLCIQCDQNAGLVTEWQVYSKSQQDLYEAELLKSQHHQVELEASRAALAEAETKLQNVSVFIACTMWTRTVLLCIDCSLVDLLHFLWYNS